VHIVIEQNVPETNRKTQLDRPRSLQIQITHQSSFPCTMWLLPRIPSFNQLGMPRSRTCRLKSVLDTLGGIHSTPSNGRLSQVHQILTQLHSFSWVASKRCGFRKFYNISEKVSNDLFSVSLARKRASRGATLPSVFTIITTSLDKGCGNL